MALSETLQTVATLDQEVPFAGLQASTLVWVSATAASGGDGSKEHPFNTIQAGIDAAQAGTAVMVMAGTYQENVKLPTVSPGTETAPVWLVSADGPQAATIVAADQTKAVIYGLGTDNFVIDGFEIQGGTRGIQFSQSGSNFTNTVSNIVISNTEISGTSDDGIKISQGDNIYILGNSISNTGGEGIDLLATNNSVVSQNEVSDAHGAAGIFAKGGSTNILISENYVHDVDKDGVIIGGWTEDQFFRPGYTGYEAKNVVVSSNIIEDVGMRPLNVLGATSSAAYGNFFEANPSYPTVVNVSTGYPRAGTVAYSSDIDIFENYITRGSKLISISSGNSSDVSFHDNFLSQISSPLSFVKSALWDFSAFATAPDLISTIPLDVHTSASSYTLDNRQTDLIYTGTSSFKGTGNSLDNVISGGRGNDVLDGKAGNDTLIGGAGNDKYIVDDYGDVVVENQNSGQDTVETSLMSYTLSENVEILKYKGSDKFVGTGNDADNTIVGGAGDDILDGKGGADSLTGGTGNDTYIIDNALDSIVEKVSAGTDTVQTSLTDYTLSRFLENLSYSGQSDFRGTGNDGDNVITGGGGNDILDGKGGADRLVGSSGDDVYYVEDVNDVVVELKNEGIDEVSSKISYTLGDNVENLTLTGRGVIDAIGNGLNNIIKGNGGANLIDGGDGVDTLYGGSGNDKFLFQIGEADGDTVADYSGAGRTIGDTLLFSGYGAGTLVQVGKSDYYTIIPDEEHGGIAAAETIHLTGVYNLNLSYGSNDYSFVI